jgi:hypothetical protein
MSETEFCQWRLFYPLISRDESIPTDMKSMIHPYTLKTKLSMLSISDEKHISQSFVTDVYISLGLTDITLKLQNTDKSSPNKIEIEIRNRHKESSPSVIEHWSRYELRSPRLELPEKILSRLDPPLIEQINKHLQRLVQEPNLDHRVEFPCVQLQKTTSLWQMDDSDRQIEETDLHLFIHDRFSPEKRTDYLYVPDRWRTIAIRTSDQHQLSKTLTTLQLDDDKDLLDYFSLLISQTSWNSFHAHQQQQASALSPEKAYMNLLTMSYAAFIELIQRIHSDRTI